MPSISEALGRDECNWVGWGAERVEQEIEDREVRGRQEDVIGLGLRDHS